MKPIKFFLDVDGTLTDGKMVYSKNGKQLKYFGPDDWNALSMISSVVDLHFISADRKGFDITQRRIEEEYGYDLDLVPGDGLQRWNFIEANIAKGQTIIYMGDGILDWYPLQQAAMGITTCDALDFVQRSADYVTRRPGGSRAVAEACIHINDYFALGTIGFGWQHHL